VRMKDNHNHIHTTPLALALTVCCLVFIALAQAHSQPPPPLCGDQSYMCNRSVPVILDPFWEHNPLSQCNGGDASSHLICSAPHPSHNLTVKRVNYTSHTMTVVPTDTLNDVCSPGFFYIDENLNSRVLQYYDTVHNVTVFLDGCPEIRGFPSKRKFTCGNNDVYYFEEGYKEQEMLDRHRALKDCKGSVRVATAAPLHQYDDSDDGAAVLQEALRDGFEVYYALPHFNCTRCSPSDGSCRSDGYDEDLVSCKYCPYQHCSPKGRTMSSIFSIPLISPELFLATHFSYHCHKIFFLAAL